MFIFLVNDLHCILVLDTSQLDIILVSKCKESQVLNHLMLPVLGAHPVILVGNQMWQIFAEEFKFWILTLSRMKLSSSQCSYNSHTSMALRIHVSQNQDAAISWDFLFVSTLCTLYMYLFRSQHVGLTRCWPLNDASSLILWWIFLAINVLVKCRY